ncbi:hypothetical protein GCM10011529_20870 [Polymorphobacter glacialis]|uniref:2-oxoglutarate-dependent ethylene/succinate-forming enzyme n=1 Tax=Sandarakinorhabdus glacialis TaxID=1614636 RepID=A0A916ZU53_9SPHN|nr:isopenicillin N synthase family oxygenase [Polymorphobacter glacialis]GGE14313.1 hypothetical protein GCM10011529_20870 [Polymorphobacter glacialis]
MFRIFRYPPGETGFGVGEHTDYGLLTLLAQDQHGGLEIRTPTGWLSAPPIPGALIVNIGDMLDRLTGGVWRSTPHRVVNNSGHERLSWPLFFDPAFDAVVEPLPGFPPRKRRPALGRRQRPRPHRHLQRLPPRQGRQGLPRPRRHHDRIAPLISS